MSARTITLLKTHRWLQGDTSEGSLLQRDELPMHPWMTYLQLNKTAAFLSLLHFPLSFLWGAG